MKKLSILKKELFLNLGIGISNLISGIISYMNLPKLSSIIILSFCIIITMTAFIPFFRKTDNEDELSRSMRNEAGHNTLKIGLIGLLIISTLLSFDSIAAVIVKKGIVELIIAYFFIFYSITFIVLTKRMEKSDEDFQEE